MSKLHRLECLFYISVDLIIACISCISAIQCQDWLKIVLLIIISLVMFYLAISGVLYMVKKTVLDSVAEE